MLSSGLIIPLTFFHKDFI